MMSNETVHDNSMVDDEASPFRDRPARRSRKRLLSMLLLLLGVGILAGGAIGLVSLLHSYQQTAAVTTPSTSKVGQHSLPQGCTPARIPLNVVAQDAANGLHLTVAQIKAQVQTGKTFAQIAATRGITARQLRTLEINALQQANNSWIMLGCITRQDMTSNMQRDVGDSAYMDAEFTDVFR
jgi:hypothetical protein